MNINRLLIIALVLITSCSRALPTIIGESSSGQSFNGSVSAVSSNPGISQMVETRTPEHESVFFKANYHIKVKVLSLLSVIQIFRWLSHHAWVDGNPSDHGQTCHNLYARD